MKEYLFNIHLFHETFGLTLNYGTFNNVDFDL